MVYQLSDYSLSELKSFAKSHKKTMKGYSKMSKGQLIESLRERLDVTETEGKKIKIKARKAMPVADLPKGKLTVSTKELVGQIKDKVEIKKTDSGIEIKKKSGKILDIELARAKEFFTEAVVTRDGERIIISKN